jgi:hypothetical protein
VVEAVAALGAHLPAVLAGLAEVVKAEMVWCPIAPLLERGTQVAVAAGQRLLAKVALAARAAQVL